MANADEKDLVIDQDELCDHIAKRFGLDADTVSDVLDAELDFLEGKGLVFEEKPAGTEDSIASATAEVDPRELTAYIAENTGVEVSLVKKILDAETSYLEGLRPKGNKG